MKTISFYISNHGFGHACRNISTIEEILKNREDLYILIKCGNKQIDFIKQLLKNYSSRVAYYEENIDVGLILKEGSIEVHKDKLRRELYKFINSWDERIAKEKEFLHYNNVDLVVSDIVPWIFKACNEVNIKSILISNFTWVEIYRELFEDEYIYKAYLNQYKLAYETWIYALYGYINEYAVNPKYIGLCCRKFDQKNVQAIKSKFKKPVVFVSVGRSVQLDKSIDVEDLPYDFIYTKGVNLVGENTYKLPVEIENTQDYIKASEYIITKAGWSTVSEAICAEKPILVMDRKEVSEDRKTIENLINLDISLTMKNCQFNCEGISQLLKEVEFKQENYNKLSVEYSNQSKKIAQNLVDILFN